MGFRTFQKLDFLLLSFASKDKERKWKKEYTYKSLNTIRVALVFVILILVILDIVHFLTDSTKTAVRTLFFDIIFILALILIISWSYYNFSYFTSVLVPMIGFGIFLYMIVTVALDTEGEPPIVLMLAICAFFILKTPFRYILLYNVIFFIFYQIMYSLVNRIGNQC